MSGHLFGNGGSGHECIKISVAVTDQNTSRLFECCSYKRPGQISYPFRNRSFGFLILDRTRSGHRFRLNTVNNTIPARILLVLPRRAGCTGLRLAVWIREFTWRALARRVATLFLGIGEACFCSAI